MHFILMKLGFSGVKYRYLNDFCMAKKDAIENCTGVCFQNCTGVFTLAAKFTVDEFNTLLINNTNNKTEENGDK